MNNYMWEYRMTFSAFKNWQLGDENLTKQEAKRQAESFVLAAANYDRAVDIRYFLVKEKELVELTNLV